MKKLALFSLIFSSYFSVFSQTEVTTSEIKNHIEFLISDKNQGRYPGGKANKRVVKYIKKEFKHVGLQAFNNNYKQVFKAKLRVEKGTDNAPEVNTSNVVGFIEGHDPLLKNEYIVLGAHYDHLGLGGPSSKSEKRGVVYHGADDNASGTAALLEIAEKLAANKDQLKRSVIFIAFGAEEQGLLGSKYFVENPLVPLSQIKLMINMDMVGRLNKNNHVYAGGAGTFNGGVEFMKVLGKSLGLNPIVHAGSVGGSDHVSFYKKNISVLGIHTGGHPQYHTPEDTLELINLEGEKLVCEYISQTILSKASTHNNIEFINQD
ncbi:M28 family metallopeptidase [Algibacter miyuki]|uniref:M28 family metallopeptidase n=1 Tax=Algibacter miyuki TaxID=1306933 RepID=A0ABV5GW14_9FLAO|nr:M20/M25/M40 family metallo-hydrolase [Algibacter miyuki]MDN3665011.1 M20/M25/M40 family metallo-hydrolase [Algibacter miyuki]